MLERYRQKKTLISIFPCDQDVEKHIKELHAMMQWNAEQIGLCEARLGQLIDSPEEFHVDSPYHAERVAEDKANLSTYIANYCTHMTYYTTHMAKLLAYAASLNTKT